MDHRQALGVLHRIFEDYVSVLPAERYLADSNETLRREGRAALMVLASSILGEPPARCYTLLCEFCHEAYSSRFVGVDFADGMGHHFCCESCLASLQIQGVLCEVSDQPVHG